ncbi:MAG TPA: glycosyltransferase [Desulfuromonadaceae bacterium]|jgi:glycosyltransferase involved in cell wall biosynthesis
MKILLISPQPFYEKRGTPLAVALLARALGELGHEIDLVSYHLGDHWPLPSVTHYRALRIPFITSISKGLSTAKLFLDIFVFTKAFNLLRRNKYDLIHGIEEGAMMGILLKKIFSVPLVYDMDSSIPEQIRDSNARFCGCLPLLALAEKLEKWTIRNSDLVLAVCEALRERVVLVHPDTPVAVLEDIPVVEKAPPGLDADVRRIRTELELEEDLPCVVYTGTFESYQGINLLLDSIKPVVAQRPETVFILVGGQPDQLPDIIHEATQRGISRYLRILGRRPLEEMPAFMAMADVLVSPRMLGSNTPMKLYAYLQSGRPVVATRLPTHTQVLNDRVAVLAEAHPAALASAIVGLLDNPALRERIGQAGARLIETAFTYDKFKSKLEKAYSQIRPC